MKCNEFHECVCEIIDKRLSDERVEELMMHAHKCPHCGYELNALALTSRIVKQKIQQQSVPAELYYSLLHRTGKKQKGFTGWLTSVFAGKALNPVAAFIVILAVAVGIYSFWIPKSPQLSDERNIISQSLKNYQAVIGGSIKPQLEDDIDNVKLFLSKEVPFDVNVPKMTGCRKCGGVLSIFDGVKLAHVVYNVGGKIVYIYQADMNIAMHGKTIGLPEKAKDELEKTGWFIKEMPSNETIILWKYKNTLCAAVSKMQKDHLLALLTHKESEK